MKTSLTALAVALLLTTACQSKKDKEEQPATVEMSGAGTPATANADTVATATNPTADNARTSLDWAGTYKGTVPCADCAGIETTLMLDKTDRYVLKTKYLGKGDGKTAERTGTFRWNDAGNTVTLDGTKDAPSQYFVGENQLTQLDMNGQKITGSLAEKYLLRKQ